MAQAVELHRPSPSLEQRVSEARSILRLATTRKQALDLAERLIGSFANCRPPNEKQFADSVALVLEKYPLGVAQECCDPQTGLALKVDFLGIRALGQWLDDRLEFYSSLAAYAQRRLPPPELPDDPAMAARVHELLRGLGAWLRVKTISPLDELIAQKWEAKRLRREEVERRAAGT